MSKYYNINGVKVRVSDHEPNFGAPGRRNDIELYVCDATGVEVLSIEVQLEHICERRGYDIGDFREILNEWKDGTYTKDVFKPKPDEDNEDNGVFVPPGESAAWKSRLSFDEQRTQTLSTYHLDKSATRADVRRLSEITGISQNFIKQHFRISPDA